jgi:hypothetical protein
MTFDSNVPVDAGDIPIASSYDKATNTFPALQSGTVTTDAFNNASAPLAAEITNATALGQQTMANSIPVVLASDQVALQSLDYYARNGQVFTVGHSSYGSATGGSFVFGFLSVFNPLASGRTLLIPRICYADDSGAVPDAIWLATSDPAYGTNADVANLVAGGGQSPVFSATCEDSTSSLPSGSPPQLSAHAANVPVEFLQNGETYILPPGNGIILGIVLTTAGAHTWAGTIIVVQL